MNNSHATRGRSRGWWSSYISQSARRYGLDPRALLAVAKQEGLSGGVGDSGTSFGPFQLHEGGALPRGRGREWAESRQGIDYALSRISQSGAKGLTGRRAIETIVRNFERPAAEHVGPEIARALAAYGQPVPAPVSVPQNTPTLSRTPAGGGGLRRSAVAEALLNPKTAHDPLRLVGAITSAQEAAEPPSSAASPPPPRAHSGASRQGGRVTFANGADRPGAHTAPEVVNFVRQVAGIFGGPLTIGTGTNHNQYVAGTHRESAHWTGHAADIPAAGAKLTRMGQDALIAAGMPKAQARKQHGGLFNIGGYQVIFNTNEGGNHFNHLHVGIHR